MRRPMLRRIISLLVLIVLAPHLQACATTRASAPAEGEGILDEPAPAMRRGDEVELMLFDGEIVYGKVGRVTRDAVMVGGEWIYRSDIRSASGRETDGLGLKAVGLALVVMVTVVAVSWARNPPSFGPDW